ncbi:MAG: SGNH/GDSL hydrolase family protein [Terracidiphilus sp.]
MKVISKGFVPTKGITCMTGPNDSNSKIIDEEKLPRRDWFLLPLLSLLTICSLIAGSELTARHLFPWRPGVQSCVVLDDPLGQHGIPNSVCREKEPETSTVEYRFNSCGHRAGMECGPKPDESYRIVMTGSSLAMGLRVKREETFAALLPKKLSLRTGRRIELYNTAVAVMEGGTPRTVALRFNDVLAAKPDMVLWILGPWDIEHVSTLYVEQKRSSAEKPGSLVQKVLQYRDQVESLSPQAINDAITDMFHRSRTALMLQHYMYQNQSLYVKHFLIGSDESAGFLKAEPSAALKSKMQEFDRYTAEIAARAQKAGVPLVAVLLPSRAQAALISMGEWPDGFNPFELDNAVRDIVTRHGGIYVDVLPDFRNVPNPEGHYFPVDGHPNASGHAVISEMLAKELTNGAIPELKAVSPPPTEAEKRN